MSETTHLKEVAEKYTDTQFIGTEPGQGFTVMYHFTGKLQGDYVTAGKLTSYIDQGEPSQLWGKDEVKFWKDKLNKIRNFILFNKSFSAFLINLNSCCI